jgi:hypothetical protein
MNLDKVIGEIIECLLERLKLEEIQSSPRPKVPGKQAVVQFEFPPASNQFRPVETVSMTNQRSAPPSKATGCSLCLETHPFVVVVVHRNPDVVDLSPLKGSAKLDFAEKGIPWTTLTYLDGLDESRNALRVVGEASED